MKRIGVQMFLSSIIGLISYLYLGSWYSFFTFSFFTFFISGLVINSATTFAFREFVLTLYSLNYLVSPLLNYMGFTNMDVVSLSSYKMKISMDEYFALAIPGILAFTFGLFVFGSSIFIINKKKMLNDISNNIASIKGITYFAFILSMARFLLNFDLGFVSYLLTLLKAVGSFALFAINPKRYWYFILFAFGLEFFLAIRSTLFHDFIMWVIFFTIFSFYIFEISLIWRISTIVSGVLFILFLQAFKVNYRNKIWWEQSEINTTTILNVTSEIGNDFTNSSNIDGSINRVNQAWIFASSVDRMNKIQDFQGFKLVNLYLEAALLPRFLAPDKLQSGGGSGREIFNKFSGHETTSGTSMGLGIFADGYIAFGFYGVVFFTLGFGMLMCLVFVIVGRWAKINQFYSFLILPILNYAIRPDCELQTVINHITKGLILYGILVTLSKYKFTLYSNQADLKN